MGGAGVHVCVWTSEQRRRRGRGVQYCWRGRVRVLLCVCVLVFFFFFYSGWDIDAQTHARITQVSYTEISRNVALTTSIGLVVCG